MDVVQLCRGNSLEIKHSYFAKVITNLQVLFILVIL